MPDSIQTATSGRSKCRGCGKAIAAGELRFGESLPNAYREGEAVYWFHLFCAASMRPEKFSPVLDAWQDPMPEREFLRDTAALGVAHRRLPRLLRAERAASGRARCRLCEDPVDKGAWRFSLHMFEEGRFSPIGTIHVECAEAYFGTIDVLPRLSRLTPELDAAALEEIALLLRTPRPRPTSVQTTPADAPAPGLAKTSVEAKPGRRQAKG